VDYLLLGPVEVWAAGRKVELKRRQERLLLAVLLLEPGKAVPTERLIGLLWPEEQPGNPKRALQVYVSRLRTVLTAADPDARLLAEAHGYAIEGTTGRTDVERFAALAEQAQVVPDLERRLEVLVEALELWRGPALADVASEDVRRRLCAGLDESRWAAQELRLETELALGRHQKLLPELAEFTGAEPTREGLAAIRMLALYRSGRQADALTVYTELVRHLDEELGIEPGVEARALQVAMLRQDESLILAPLETGPRELPADYGLLVGRDELLGELAEVLASAGRGSGVPAVVCLYGGAGTGKSAVAVRLGHRLADEFPDGQVFVRLQDDDGDAVPVRTVLARLLRSLAVDPKTFPDSLEERSSLLRSTLAGRSVLLVFDDVLDAGQLRPLMPAEGRCAVIATSRQPLLGLEDAIHRDICSADGQEIPD
jgi:DNA-binding SARP family transcriptional activator